RNRPRDGAGSSVGHPDRPRRPWRLDAPASADPLRPLRLRHRWEPRSGPPRRRQPRRHPHLGLRVVLGDRRPRRHTARFLFLRSVQHQYRRPRSARPVLGGRGRHRRGQPLRRPGGGRPPRSRRPPPPRPPLPRGPAPPWSTCPPPPITPFPAPAPP